MKKFFSNIWSFLDGNKTLIGTGIAYGSKFIPDPDLAELVQWIGLSIAGGGLVHKAKKTVTKPDPKGKNS